MFIPSQIKENKKGYKGAIRKTNRKKTKQKTMPPRRRKISFYTKPTFRGGRRKKVSFLVSRSYKIRRR